MLFHACIIHISSITGARASPMTEIGVRPGRFRASRNSNKNNHRKYRFDSVVHKTLVPPHNFGAYNERQQINNPPPCPWLKSPPGG